MNRIMTEYYPTFQMYQALRDQLMTILTDEDLRYTPGGANPPLGTLCREIGEVEYAYIQSFKTFALDFSYSNPAPGLAESVAQLTAWFAALDQDLRATIEGLSEDDIANRLIDRGGDFQLPPQIQLSVYNEALLIFCGKVSVYLKAMGKTLPQQWQDWLG
jgi:uncharacterized damage-inducible protein DinB